VSDRGKLMSTSSNIVIVGAGLAGAEAAFALRECGHTGRILMIGRENWLPYDRPPLSKSYLKGDLARERLWLRPQNLYKDNGIELLLGNDVTSIDRTARCLYLDTGSVISYDRLLLATGGEARMLAIPGAHLNGVCTLKSLDDADQLRAKLERNNSVVIIGGGYLGMEFAATACQAGCKVTVLESQAMLLSRTLSAEIARYLRAEHEKRGVCVMTQVGVERIEGDDCAKTVVLTNGLRLSADIVLVSIGNQASDGLAHSAGLTVDRGILVDSDGRTSDPHVFAAGDCAASRREGFESPQRLESVQSATSQAKRAAAAMIGHTTGGSEIPWFWSDQFDIKLQIAGLPLPGDTALVRGSAEAHRFSVIYQNSERMTAIQCVNAPGDFAAAKRMIAERRIYPPELLTNPLIGMREIRLSTNVDAATQA
jgi:3-phenylpropionate/trans-cinnamate dioxygenase ferredoxin reductase subunit